MVPETLARNKSDTIIVWRRVHAGQESAEVPCPPQGAAHFRMNQVGVTRSYNAMMSKVPAVPFAKAESVDLDHYVTTKALDGLFYMVGQEEQKVRTNPGAQTTDLLKSVFGK